MAKLQEYRAGKFRFKLRGKYFYLPGLTKRDAESVQEKVEKLVSAKASGSRIPDRIAVWLGEECPDEQYQKLVGFDLVAPRALRMSSTVLAFVDQYIARRTDVAHNTVLSWGKARNQWEKRYRADLRLEDVTAADAMQFRRDLLADAYAEASVRCYCGHMKHFFEQAIDAELITRNPFRKVKSSSVGNEERQEFVPREAIDQVLANCPDAEFRLLVCLSRYGGLRCPSESDALCWSDIDVDEGEFIVRSPKTGTRTVPLFPELVEPLRDAFEAAVDGTTHVIVKHRGGVRRQLGRAVERAGLEPWPKIFHNLRASRETELTEQFPLHVVCKWIGNSPQVANRHYLQVRPEDMERAKGRAWVAPDAKVPESFRK